MAATHVLLIEDNPGDQRLVCEAVRLYAKTIHLQIVGDGQTAIDFLLNQAGYPDFHMPSLVILDLNLPKKSGWEVLKQIKEHQSLRGVPVIIFSTSSNPDEIQKAYFLHANCFVAKPSELDAFFCVIRTIFEYWCETTQLPGRGNFLDSQLKYGVSA